MRIGLHVSIAGKIQDSLERAKALGCNTMQIFSRNPRGWAATRLDKNDALEFRRLKEKYDINPVIIHIPYLINLSTPDDQLYEKSIAAYMDDLKRADMLGAEYFVTHLGSHVGSGEEAGINRFSAALDMILNKTKPVTMVLLENTAGSGASIGYKFEHIRMILEGIGKNSNVGVCLDTAHAFEAGYDLKSKSGFTGTFNEFDRLIGVNRIKAVHFNDSLSAKASKVDRHQHIGKGKIGLEGLKRVIRYPGLKDAAFIMETPKENDKDDLKNMAAAKRMIR